MTLNPTRWNTPADDRVRDPLPSVRLRTLIHHEGALGDVLLSLSCFHALQEEGDDLCFVGRPDIGRLLVKSAAVNDFTSSDSGMFASLFASGSDERARAFLSRFDRAFLFVARRDPVLMENMSRALPEVRTIATLPPEGVRTHVAEFRLMQISGIASMTAPVGLVISQAVLDAALNTLVRAGYDGRRELIAIQPGSGGRAKCWSLDRYFETAARLSAGTGAFILFLSGPAEEPAMKERIDGFSAGGDRIAHLADANLVDVAGVLSRCDLFLGNDSGISHLAAAAGCPVVALYGPSDPALWRPRGQDVQVIAGDTIGSITVDQVTDAVRELLFRRAGHHCAVRGTYT